MVSQEYQVENVFYQGLGESLHGGVGQHSQLGDRQRRQAEPESGSLGIKAFGLTGAIIVQSASLVENPAGVLEFLGAKMTKTE